MFGASSKWNDAISAERTISVRPRHGKEFALRGEKHENTEIANECNDERQLTQLSQGELEAAGRGISDFKVS